MSLTSKTVRAGIVFTFLTTGLLGLSMASFASGSDLSREDSAVVNQIDVKKVQQTLCEKGHYRGKVDGVLGLRTRASIRAFQKAENLPVTGQLDTQTAGKLGVRAEVIGGGSHGSGLEIAQGIKETGYETTSGKPSAGIKRAKGSARSTETPAKAARTASDTESARRDREKKLQAENLDHPQ